MRDGKKLLRELHDLSPVPLYVRAHHLLTTGNGVAELKWSSTNVYTEDSNGILTISVADSLLEADKPAVFEVTGSATDSQRWFGVYLANNDQHAAR